MIRRFYVHNYRCFENFELALDGLPSVLLLGQNGSGKSTVAFALRVLQSIGRGTSRVAELVSARDLSLGRIGVPMRFEIEVSIDRRVFIYTLVLEFPTRFRELRVKAETLTVDGEAILSRELAQVRLARASRSAEEPFRLNWHLLALPLRQEYESDDPLSVFRRWLADILILRPVPSLARGDYEPNADVPIAPDLQVTDIGQWFAGIVAALPGAYADIKANLQDVMPDFRDIKTMPSSGTGRRLIFQFAIEGRDTELTLEQLSDGERCFVVFALAIAATNANPALVCFWDEPEAFLSPGEIGQSIMALRSAFQKGGQLITTSHNAEAIRQFSEENTFYFNRHSHLEPTTVASVASMRDRGKLMGDLNDALLIGDLEA